MLSWKIGFEVETLAPPGLSRRHLSERVARRCSGTVRRFFHPQSEPSEVPGLPVFENLTLGFEVVDEERSPVAWFVDDLTLQADLDRDRPPLAPWYRIVADDPRLLRLAMRHCDPEARLETVLDPFAALFGTKPQRQQTGMVRIVDGKGASVAIAAPLPGERERPCEIVTAPIEKRHDRVLSALLADARRLGFTLPAEGAAHIHFDAKPLLSARAVAAVVAVLERHGPALRTLVKVNPNCTRLGGWPPELAQLTSGERFLGMDWPQAKSALASLPLVKYCDFNLCNLIGDEAAKQTFEIRILPASLEPQPIISAAMLFEGLLAWCRDAPLRPSVPSSLADLIDVLPLSRQTRDQWARRARRLPPSMPAETIELRH